ncbi:hypothetical protein [Microlunatus sp. Y2014]|uniref:hypothetical protein n=1 Tax=Microlunatus sp. Y2014 TaxID=3418488 RepID=UPI003DA76701
MSVLGTFVEINELVLPYDETATKARRDRYFKSFLFAIVGLVVSALIALVFWLIFRWNDPLIWGLYIAVGALSLFRIGYALTRWLINRRTHKRMPDGTAVKVDRSGIIVGDGHGTWDEVTSVVAVTPWWSKSARLQLTTTSDRSVLPVDQLPAVLSTVDSAVSVFSQGRHRIDTSRLDR